MDWNLSPPPPPPPGHNEGHPAHKRSSVGSSTPSINPVAGGRASGGPDFAQITAWSGGSEKSAPPQGPKTRRLSAGEPRGTQFSRARKLAPTMGELASPTPLRGVGEYRLPHSGSQFSGSRKLGPAVLSRRQSAHFGPLRRSRFLRHSRLQFEQNRVPPRPARQPRGYLRA